MACGTPTVVTTEGGLWEQVAWGLEALYANPFDPEAFGHAICSILTYPRVYGQLAKFGSQKARSRFTWTGVAQQILGLLENVRRGDYGARLSESAEIASEASVANLNERHWAEEAFI